MLVLAACDVESSVATNIPPSRSEDISGPIQPLPARVETNAKKVRLGQRLFFDKRLSRDGSVACASCHSLDHYGVDNRRVAVGIDGHLGNVNAPTVLNSGFNFRQFWDGRAASLEEQVGGPVTNPAEMGARWAEVIPRLQGDGEINALSLDAFGVPINEDVVRSALAEYERSLVTPDAPFDRYLRGDANALSAEAREGWRLFRQIGCASCHQGINIGGNMYATLGVMGNYFEGRAIEPSDLGLFNRTGREQDRYKFKVPSLRNVAETAPYFHDGRIDTLEDAVDVMARTQLGLRLRTEDRQHLVAFLKSLTGKLAEPAP